MSGYKILLRLLMQLYIIDYQAKIYCLNDTVENNLERGGKYITIQKNICFIFKIFLYLSWQLSSNNLIAMIAIVLTLETIILIVAK